MGSLRRSSDTAFDMQEYLTESMAEHKETLKNIRALGKTHGGRGLPAEEMEEEIQIAELPPEETIPEETDLHVVATEGDQGVSPKPVVLPPVKDQRAGYPEKKHKKRKK